MKIIRVVAAVIAIPSKRKIRYLILLEDMEI